MVAVGLVGWLAAGSLAGVLAGRWLPSWLPVRLPGWPRLSARRWPYGWPLGGRLAAAGWPSAAGLGIGAHLADLAAHLAESNSRQF